MSIELNWKTVTTGPDGLALAETIRSFIHARFQTITLPRFIKSVKVHAFEFGAIAPEIELKDICDPLPDFYEHDSESEFSSEEEDGDPKNHLPAADSKEGKSLRERRRAEREPSKANSPDGETLFSGLRPLNPMDAGSPFFGTHTPGISGGTSNLNYFHSHLASGLSGTQTPLAAVAGKHLPNGWPDYSQSGRRPNHHHSQSASSISPPDSGDGVSSFSPAGTRPPTQDGIDNLDGSVDDHPATPPRRFRERRVEDLQTVFRVQYSGDIRLSLTAEILLDYPMPSFVGIPLQLNITGLSFDGVAVLAYIRKKAHFCFLSHEDALNAIGPEDLDDPANLKEGGLKMGGLLQEIKVESEIGQREGGKQVLKNVGKVEKFVLEQVRRIFEDEFVYPSFWTFLV